MLQSQGENQTESLLGRGGRGGKDVAEKKECFWLWSHPIPSLGPRIQEGEAGGLCTKPTPAIRSGKGRGFHPFSLPLFPGEVSLCTVTLTPPSRASLGNMAGGERLGWRGVGEEGRRAVGRTVCAGLCELYLCHYLFSRRYCFSGPDLPCLSSSSSFEIPVEF